MSCVQMGQQERMGVWSPKSDPLPSFEETKREDLPLKDIGRVS